MTQIVTYRLVNILLDDTAIIWIRVNSPQKKPQSIYSMIMFSELHKVSVLKSWLNATHLKSKPHLPVKRLGLGYILTLTGEHTYVGFFQCRHWRQGWDMFFIFPQMKCIQMDSVTWLIRIVSILTSLPFIIKDQNYQRTISMYICYIYIILRIFTFKGGRADNDLSSIIGILYTAERRPLYWAQWFLAIFQ